LKSTVTEPESWKRIVEIEIPAEEIAAAVEKKLGKYRRDARLPGFRQGKTPISVVKQRFGEMARAEVIEDAARDAFKAACEEHGVVPVCEAVMTDMKSGEGEPLRFTIETQVDPPIEITGYGDLQIRAKPGTIEDSAVEDNFNGLLERFADYVDVDRPAKIGDCVRLEYRKVVVNGEERVDLRNHSPQQPVELGSAKGFEALDRGIVGLSAGGEADIEWTFPMDYPDKSLAGQGGEFSVTVLSVQEKILPKADGDFLSKLGNFETVDAVKEELRRSLEHTEAERARREAHTEAVEALIKANPFEVPPSKVDGYTKIMIEDFIQNSGGQLEPTEEMVKMLAENFRDAAVAALKRLRILDYIAEKEKIKATQDEVDRQIAFMAQQYGYEFDEVKQIFRKNGTTNRIRLEIREKKTLDFLIGENDNN